MLMARTLGCTLAELRRRMTYAEMVQWIASYSVEPWGDVRVDRAAALVGAVVANANRGKRKARVKLRDLMPTWGWEKVRQTPEQMLRYAVNLTRRLGGKVLRGDGDINPKRTDRGTGGGPGQGAG